MTRRHIFSSHVFLEEDERGRRIPDRVLPRLECGIYIYDIVWHNRYIKIAVLPDGPENELGTVSNILPAGDFSPEKSG